MKTIIIGAGLTGLVAAYKLGGDVLILEKDSEVGGLLSSYHINNFHIEKYYHHLIFEDKELIGLINELNLGKKLEWLRSKNGYYIQGKVYPMNTPLEILRFPFLSFIDKIRLGWLVYRIKKINKVKIDNILAKEWIIKNVGLSVYENFFEPLLQSKFGINKEKISAAWLASRIQFRSNRGLKGEMLGYLRGGFYTLIDSLVRTIKKQGGKIRTGFNVSKIKIKNGEIKGVFGGNEFLPCERIISTIGPRSLIKILEPNLFNRLNIDLKYQGVVCAIFGLKKNLLNDIYWLNIKADVPFGAIIEHTNFLPFSDYGEYLIYIVSYFQDPMDPLWRLPKEKIIELYLTGIKKMFPNFSKSNVKWWRLTRTIEASPIYEIGYKTKIVPYITSIKGLYLAGMFSNSNYPERSMNGSVRAGFEVAKSLRNI